MVCRYWVNKKLSGLVKKKKRLCAEREKLTSATISIDRDKPRSNVSPFFFKFSVPF